MEKLIVLCQTNPRKTIILKESVLGNISVRTTIDGYTTDVHKSIYGDNIILQNEDRFYDRIYNYRTDQWYPPVFGCVWDRVAMLKDVLVGVLSNTWGTG